MAAPQSTKKKGKTLLEKRRLKEAKRATQVKRKRKGDRIGF